MRRGSIPRRRASVAALLCALVGAFGAHPAHAEVTVKAALDRAQVTIGEAADLGVEVHGVQNSGVPSIANAGGASVSYLGPSSRVSFPPVGPCLPRSRTSGTRSGTSETIRGSPRDGRFLSERACGGDDIGPSSWTS